MNRGVDKGCPRDIVGVPQPTSHIQTKHIYMNRGVDKGCPNRNIVGVPVPVPVPCTKEQLKRTFWRFDANGDRKLSRKELKEAFDYLGAYIPGWRAFRALNHADNNGDGYINEEEVDELINYAVKSGYLKS